MAGTGVLLGLLIPLVCWLLAAHGKTLHGERPNVTEPREGTGPCHNIWCGEGRECETVDGAPVCRCARSCPPTLELVCGSDTRTYPNMCVMRRIACYLQSQVEKLHKGPCYVPRAKRHTLFQPMEKPLVCQHDDADKVRNLILTHNNDRKLQENDDMDVEFFMRCDTDRNMSLSEDEFVLCTRDILENQSSYTQVISQEIRRLRLLCVKTLWSLYDKNTDRILSYEEFIELLNSKTSRIPRKKCLHDGKQYEEGDEERSNCNICVCTLGNWICSATHCIQNFDNAQDKFRGEYEQNGVAGPTDTSTPTARNAFEPEEMIDGKSITGWEGVDVQATDEALEEIDLSDDFREENEQLLVHKLR